MKTSNKSSCIAGIILSLPAIVIMGTFTFYPLLRTITDSLFKFSLISKGMQWVGLNNYIELFQDKIFYTSLLNNLMVATLSIIIQLSLGTILAAITSRGLRKTSALARTIVFMPIVFSSVAIALLWGLIYDMNVGQLINIFDSLGLNAPECGFLGSRYVAMVCIITAGCWQRVGFMMIIMIAAMAGITEDLYEASTLDGAGPIRQFFSITLPNCKNVLMLCALITVIGAFKCYDLIRVLTDGGPSHQTEVVGTYIIYNAFNLSRMGYADCISVALLVIAGLVGVLQLFINKRNAR